LTFRQSAIRLQYFCPRKSIIAVKRTTVRAAGQKQFSLPAAAADVAAWCAVINYGEYWDCQYRSFEECRPNALAKRGWCNPSPYFASSPTEYRRPKKSRGQAQ
jgi:hypothetical protein